MGRLLLLVPSCGRCLNIKEFQQQDDVIMIEIYKKARLFLNRYGMFKVEYHGVKLKCAISFTP